MDKIYKIKTRELEQLDLISIPEERQEELHLQIAGLTPESEVELQEVHRILIPGYDY